MKFKSTIKAAGFASLAVAVFTYGFNLKESQAALTAPNGKCAVSLNTNFSGLNPLATNSSAKGNTITAMSLGTIDFDEKTVSYIDTEVTNYGGTNQSPSTSSKSGSTRFEIASGAFDGLYVITFPSGSKINVISTNSGKTYFLSGRPTDGDNGPQPTGVCQAL